MSRMTKKQVLAEIERIEEELDNWAAYNGKRQYIIEDLKTRRDDLYNMLSEE